MIVERAEGPLDDVEFSGADRAHPTAEVLAALAEAQAIVIGPSNPVASIAPILALPGMRGERSPAPPFRWWRVSPFVGGEVLKGPTRLFCERGDREPNATGLLNDAGLLDGVVAGEAGWWKRTALRGLLMRRTSERRRAVAKATLDFARFLVANRPGTIPLAKVGRPPESANAHPRDPSHQELRRSQPAPVRRPRLGGGWRQALAQAMFSDVLTALGHVPGLEEVAVVSANRLRPWSHTAVACDC